MNFLEQLVAEWYEYHHKCFVRTNIPLAKAEGGGYVGDMDVVALKPGTLDLTHVETAIAVTPSWDKVADKLRGKFEKASASYKERFGDKEWRLEKVAVLGLAKSNKIIDAGEGVEVKSGREFVEEITRELAGHNPLNDIVPETFPLLRALQLGVHYGAKKG